MTKKTNVVNVTNNVAPTTEKTYTLNVKIDGVENSIEYGLHTKNRILGEASATIINPLKDKQVCVIYNDTHSVKFLGTSNDTKNRSAFALSLAKFIAINQNIDYSSSEGKVLTLKVTPLLSSYYKDNKALKEFDVNKLTFEHLNYTNIQQAAKVVSTSIKAIHTQCKAANVKMEVLIRQNKTITTDALNKIAVAFVSAGVANSSETKRAAKLLELAASNK
jgi:uncharacterized lipoprotein YehR (DUF1307 family)